MNTNEIEDLFLRSLDQPLSDAEKEQLVNALRTNSGLAKDVSRYKSIRESVLRSKLFHAHTTFQSEPLSH